MGSEFLSRKPHYDITMSKRTRKPTHSNLINIQESADHHHHHHHQPAENCISATVKMNQVVNEVCDHEGIIQGDDEEEESKKSLKQLIEGRRRGTSLGEHFTAEEKQLQVAVVKPAEDGGGSNGVKFKHMISRYTKVLSHMMKLRRDASKPHFRLKVQQLQK